MHKQKFQAVWDHVTGQRRNVASPMMLLARDAMMAALEGERIDTRGLYRFSQRINQRSEKHEWVERYRPLMTKSTGEWQVTNADLELWADLCLFGERSFPEEWLFISNSITASLFAARRYQIFQKYQAGGGVTKEHRLLLKRLGWEVSLWRSDGVSLFVQGKRPYGNSCREQDMVGLLGWEAPWLEKDELMPVEVKERVWELFDQLPFVLCDLFDGEIPNA